MEFSEEQHNVIPHSRQVLCSIVSRYPAGISDLELKNEYMKIQKFDIRTSNVSTELYEMKGTLVDFRTTNGFRIFSLLRKRMPVAATHPHIQPCADAHLHTVYPVSVIDCNSFCVYLAGEEEECLRYTQYIHEYCKSRWTHLYAVPKWQICVGDCYFTFSSRFNYYLRVKVIERLDDTSAVMCFLVDLGRYDSFAMSDLRVAPELCLYLHHTLKVPKYFKKHAYAIRCYLDVTKKPYGGFPFSRTGLHIALCGNEEFRNCRLKMRFLAYDADADAYMVDVLDDDGVTPKLVAAVATDTAILEKDKFYVMNIDGDDEQHMFETEDDNRERFEQMVAECENAFSVMGS